MPAPPRQLAHVRRLEPSSPLERGIRGVWRAGIVIAVLATSCNRGGEPAPVALGLDGDVAVARFEVTEAVASGCAGLQRAAIAIGRFPDGDGRVELVRTAAKVARESCPGDRAFASLWAAGASGRLVWAELVGGAAAAGMLRSVPPGPARDRLLGERLLAEERAAAALEPLRRAAPASVPARISLVRALLATGALEEAATVAAALPTDELSTSTVVVRALAARGDLDAVRAQIAAAPLPWRRELAVAAAVIADPLALATDDAPVELLVAAGERLLAGGRGDEAVIVLRRARAEAPGDADLALRLGDALGTAGLVDAAVDAYDAARELSPTSFEATRRPIALLAQRGKARAARARAAAVRQAAGDDPDALDRAAEAFLAAEHLPGAVEAARAAVAARPGDGRLSFALAGYLEAAGRPAEAEAVYLELLRCGARGQPWHRHEVAGRLLRAARRAGTSGTDLAARVVAEASGCQVPAAAELDGIADGLRRGLAEPETRRRREAPVSPAAIPPS